MKGLKEQMTKKYIVKNCPSYDEHSVEWNCLNETNANLLCEDCTDCLIKQVVEKCKNIECPCEYKGADCWECSTAGQKTLAEKILQLFTIEEVE